MGLILLVGVQWVMAIFFRTKQFNDAEDDESLESYDLQRKASAY